MDIGKKIEEIRSKPEHVRERYAWIAVGICMVFIVIIWLFSFKMIFKRENNKQESVAPVTDLIDKSKKSLEDLPSLESIQQEGSAPTK